MKNIAFKEIVIFLILLLFAYTSCQKVIEHQQFVFQLSLSPVPFMKTLAPYLGWIIPLTEIVIIVALLIEKTRIYGLYASLTLLISFELYITYMLLSGLDLPCACGGIIALMSWKQHILFNAFFIGISVLAIKLYRKTALDMMNVEVHNSENLKNA
jgi:hypothetical protein